MFISEGKNNLYYVRDAKALFSSPSNEAKEIKVQHNCNIDAARRQYRIFFSILDLLPCQSHLQSVGLVS